MVSLKIFNFKFQKVQVMVRSTGDRLTAAAADPSRNSESVVFLRALREEKIICSELLGS